MGLALHVRDLTVASRRGRLLLTLPELDLPAGGLLGVRGPSGAGKSTFLNALSGLLDAKGRVQWGETDIASLSPDRRTAFRAAQMGMIFQDFLLFEELSAEANAALTAQFAPAANRPGILSRARDRLSRLAVPSGARTVESFSGGERQRVAVARALASDPQVILADEPTAALDRTAADRLVADLVSLCRDGGKTLVVVSHDLHLLDAMDRVVTIEDGQVTG